MLSTEEKLLDAAVDMISRYGLRRASMADIAQAAGVSRQSVYAKFGNKEGLLAAAVAHVWHKGLRDLDTAFAQASGLGPKLDAFFEILIIPFYDAMQRMPDLEDLLKGLSAQTQTGAAEATLVKRQKLQDQLVPYQTAIEASGLTVESLTTFVEVSATAFKYSAKSHQELRALLTTLKVSVLRIAQADQSITPTP